MFIQKRQPYTGNLDSETPGVRTTCFYMGEVFCTSGPSESPCVPNPGQAHLNPVYIKLKLS